MNLERKLQLLDRVYEFYGRLARNFEYACRKGCAWCCTQNVTVTTLEAYRIISALNEDARARLVTSLNDARHHPRFSPALTINRIAEICRQGLDVPGEAVQPPASACPLLREQVCPLYDLRPFGCRCFISETECRQEGCADVNDYVLSVNTLFLQIIEHIDHDGCSGNLADVLFGLLSRDGRNEYEHGRLNCVSKEWTANHPMTVLMVPPEHRQRMQPVIESLGGIITSAQ